MDDDEPTFRLYGSTRQGTLMVRAFRKAAADCGAFTEGERRQLAMFADRIEIGCLNAEVGAS